MAKKITILNHKGGVGKTTTAVNLAAGLNELGKKVLVIDLDPQANASYILGFDEPDYSSKNKEDAKEINTVYDAMKTEVKLIKNGNGEEIEIIPPLPCYEYRDGFDLCPATSLMTEADKDLNGRSRRDEILCKLLKPFEGEYDYILMDCPPNLGLLTTNAMCACESIIVPIDRPLSVKGMGDVLKKIESLRVDINRGLHIEGFLLNNYSSRLNIVNEIRYAVEELNVAPLFNARIHHIEKLSEMAKYRKTILDIDKKSTATDNYRQLAREIVKKG